MKQMLIPNKEYSLKVQNRIEDNVEDILFEIIMSLAEEFDFSKEPIIRDFHDVYVDYAGDIRDKAIELFEEAGMPIRTNWGDY